MIEHSCLTHWPKEQKTLRTSLWGGQKYRLSPRLTKKPTHLPALPRGLFRINNAEQAAVSPSSPQPSSQRHLYRLYFMPALASKWRFPKNTPITRKVPRWNHHKLRSHWWKFFVITISNCCRTERHCMLSPVHSAIQHMRILIQAQLTIHYPEWIT